VFVHRRLLDKPWTPGYTGDKQREFPRAARRLRRRFAERRFLLSSTQRRDRSPHAVWHSLVVDLKPVFSGRFPNKNAQHIGRLALLLLRDQSKNGFLLR
jgi:hypothetical protein